MRTTFTTITLVAALFAAPDPAAVKVQGPDTIGTAVPTFASGLSAAGSFQTPLVSSQSGAASALTATLAAAPGKFTYISGFEITGGGATTAVQVVPNITGIAAGVTNYVVNVGSPATANTPSLTVTFIPPIPSTAVNTAIVVNVPSFGAGNLGAAVVAHGFQQ